MKKLAGCALVLTVPLVIFFGIVWFVLANPDDASDLTDEVEVTLLDAHDLGGDYRVEYAYRVEGQWYAGEETFTGTYWEPGEPIRGCVDAADPSRHSVTVTVGDRCGDDTLSNGVNTGTPTSAPTDLQG